MQSTLNNLYNNGNNEGDIILNLLDGTIRCHSFVLIYTSSYFKNNMNTLKCSHDINIMDYETGYESDGITYQLPLQTTKKIANIIMAFLYNEKVIDIDLNGQEIIELFDNIRSLQFGNFVIILKNHYMNKFKYEINTNNWLLLLKITINDNFYTVLTDKILDYYQNNILTSIDDICESNIDKIIDEFINCDPLIVKTLYKRCLMKIVEMNVKLNDNSDNGKLFDNKNINKIIKNCIENSDSDEEIYSDENIDDQEQVESDSICDMKRSKNSINIDGKQKRSLKKKVNKKDL